MMDQIMDFAASATGGHRYEVALFAALFVCLMVTVKSVLPAQGLKMARAARRDGTLPAEARYGGLESYRITPYPGEQFDPLKLVGAFSDPKVARCADGEPLVLEFQFSTTSRAAVSGRGAEAAAKTIQSRYGNSASLRELSPEQALAAPAGAGGSPGGSHSAEGGPPRTANATAAADADMNPGEGNPNDGDSGEGAREALSPMIREYRIESSSGPAYGFGPRSLSEYARGEESLAGGIYSIENLIDPTSGERALIQLYLRPATRASVADLENAEEAHKAGGSRPRRAVARVLGAFLFLRHKFVWMLRMWQQGGEKDDKPKETKQSAYVGHRLRGSTHYNLWMVVCAWLPASKHAEAASKFDNHFKQYGQGQFASPVNPARRSSLTEDEVALRLAYSRPPKSKRALPVVTGEEIAALWHPLSQSVSLQRLEQEKLATVPPPPGIPENGVRLAVTNHPGRKADVKLTPKEFCLHGVLRGVTGVGKSSLFCRLVEGYTSATNEHGKKMGCMILDPTYSFVNSVMQLIPAHRQDDIIMVDAASTDYPCPGLNLLDCPEEFEVASMASMLTDAIRMRMSSWGPRLEEYLRYSLMALIGANEMKKRAGERPEYVITDISKGRFLAPRDDEEEGEPPPLRGAVLNYLRGDPDYAEVVDFWYRHDQDKKAAKQSEEVDSVTNKVSQLNHPRLKQVLCAPERQLDLMRAMDEGKIVVVNVPKDIFDGGTHALFGTLLINLVLRTSMKRYGVAQADNREDELREFGIFVDEVQDFICHDMEEIFSQARKYRCPMWVAHQYISQIRDEVIQSAMTQAGTSVYFQLTAKDAALIGKEFDEPFGVASFNDMPQFNFVLKPREGRPITASTVPTPERSAELEKSLRRRSAERYVLRSSPNTARAQEPGLSDPADSGDLFGQADDLAEALGEKPADHAPEDPAQGGVPETNRGASTGASSGSEGNFETMFADKAAEGIRFSNRRSSRTGDAEADDAEASDEQTVDEQARYSEPPPGEADPTDVDAAELEAVEASSESEASSEAHSFDWDLADDGSPEAGAEEDTRDSPRTLATEANSGEREISLEDSIRPASDGAADGPTGGHDGPSAAEGSAAEGYSPEKASPGSDECGAPPPSPRKRLRRKRPPSDGGSSDGGSGEVL